MKLEDKILKQMEYEKPYITELFGPNKYFNGPLTVDERKLLEEYIHDKNNPQWKTIIIDGKETNYEISNIGEVRNKTTGYILKNSLNEFGYNKIGIVINNHSYSKKVHRLVAIAFIPNPENKREVNHINCIKTCNWYKNLEWLTSSENKIHAWKNGLYENSRIVGVNKPNSIYTEKQVHAVCKMLEEGKGQKEISETLNVAISLINSIKFSGKWKYISSQYNIDSTNKLPKRKKDGSPNSAKLTINGVENICKLMMKNISDKDIAKLYNVSKGTISDIRLGTSWRNITSKYKLPIQKSDSPAIQYKTEIIELLSKGETDFGKIINIFNLPDTRRIRKYIAHLKFKLKINNKEKRSSTIENSDI